MKPLLVANWKMNPATPREARELLATTKRALRGNNKFNVVVCPPVLFLPDLAARVKDKSLVFGAQDSGWETATGPFTGAVGPALLAYVGARYVLLGHSERRAAGENDEQIRRKIKAVLSAGLRAIVCLGESERDQQGFYLEFLKQQLLAAVAGLPKPALAQLLLAYEPVWAVGAKAVAADTPADFLHQAIFLRKILSGLFGREAAGQVPILYGGSVDAKNAADFLTEGQAGGLLVGRASLEPDKFFSVVQKKFNLS